MATSRDRAVLPHFAYLWWTGAVGLLVGQLGITIAFLAYQVIYWNLDPDR